jgi:hypothetical protein
MITALVSLAIAGPWTRSHGDAYVKAGADYYYTTKYVLPAESGLAATGDFGTDSFFGHQYSVYGEAGISDAWPIQLAVRAPLTVSVVDFAASDTVNVISGTATSTRMGDLELMPQVALSKKHPIAFGLGVKLPLYNVDNVCAGSVYRDFCGRPGDGQLDVTPWLLAGGSFFKGKAWAEGQVGYRWRSEAYRNWDTTRAFIDSLAFGGTLGAKVGPTLLMVRLDGNRNFSGLVYDKSYADPIVQAATDANKGEDPFTLQSIRFGPQAMLLLSDHWALEGRAQWDVWAQSTSIGVGFGGGVSWRGQLFGG